MGFQAGWNHERIHRPSPHETCGDGRFSVPGSREVASVKPARAVAVIVYNLIAKRMPASNGQFSFGARKLRAWCAGHMLERCGKNVNVERNATFGRNVTLGNCSGIGTNAVVGKHTHIGDYVMMGPNVTLATAGHPIDPELRKKGLQYNLPVSRLAWLQIP